MVDVLSSLRREGHWLSNDLTSCGLKRNEAAILSIIDAMNSLDEAANAVEDIIRDRAWSLEKAVEYYKDHPCSK